MASFFGTPTMASHIVGGNITYKHIADNLYEARLAVYRDCGPSAFTGFNEDPIKLGIYDLGTHRQIDSVSLKTKSTYPLKFNEVECIAPNSQCVEVRIYTGEFRMNSSTFNNIAGYYLSWQRCCRNRSTVNILSPGTTGMAFYAEIPSPHPVPLVPAIINSSPQFKNEAKSYLCLDKPFTFNFEVTDIDGDELRYSLTEPLKGNTGPGPNVNNGDNTYMESGPYDKITWANGYGVGNIMDGSPNLTIDQTSGDITVTPLKLGTYVVSVLVEEYRLGIKIGEIRRELQFSVVICTEVTVPAISFPGTTEKVQDFVFDIGQENCISIFAQDKNKNEELTLHSLIKNYNPFQEGAYFTPKGGTGYGTLNGGFCWTPPCGIGEDKVIEIGFVVKDYSCLIPYYDTIWANITLIRSENTKPEFIGSQPETQKLNAGDELELNFNSIDLQKEDIVFIGANIKEINQDPALNARLVTVSKKGKASGSLFISGECNLIMPKTVGIEYFTYDSTCFGSDTTFAKTEVIIYPTGYGKYLEKPNAFSPNSDGVNDFFELTTNFNNNCNYNFIIKIYDRWGGIVFESTNPKFKWDGGDSPDGAYVYFLKSEIFSDSGTIYITR